MSWFPEKRTQSAWYHRLCTRILKSGPVPNHIAIIMDGNRRFAQKNSMDRAEGHLKGFDKLAEVRTASYTVINGELRLSGNHTMTEYEMSREPNSQKSGRINHSNERIF